MSLRNICDAWLLDIQTHVSDLADATPHRYAIWGQENFGDAGSGRHLAVFPIPAGELVRPFTVGSLPSDLETHAFRVLIWEAAMAETTRLFDDDDANGAWLDLFETVKARLRVQSDTSLGTVGGYTRYTGWTAGIMGTARFMQIDFSVQESAQFTA